MLSSYRISGTIGRMLFGDSRSLLGIQKIIMFQQNIKTMNMLCICPECKNTIDLSRYPKLAVGMIIECNHCGITLLVKNIADDGAVATEIVDEGK